MTPDVETVIPKVWADALTFAVKKNKGILKVSSVKNHILGGKSNATADEARAVLAAMQRDGYLSEPVKSGQVYEWTVTDKGREAVQ